MRTEIQDRNQNSVSVNMSPSVRQRAERLSSQEGISLNEFINLALAERMAVLEHEAWVATRRPMTAERSREALAILDKAGDHAPMPGDELPEGYERIKY